MLWLLHVKLERPEPYVARSRSRAINPGTKVVKNSIDPLQRVPRIPGDLRPL